MRVLIVTPYYLPDLGPSAALYAMLAEELVRLGSEVSVISAIPHYPTGSVPQEFRGRLFQREERNGVHVIRVWVPSIDRARLALRALQFVCHQTLASLAGLQREYDVVILSNPALEVFLPFLVLGVLRRKPIIFSVHEIYPEVGIKLGVFRHRVVIRIVDSLERFCYRKARFVRVLSEGYKRTLEQKGVHSFKLRVIGDWVDTDFVRPLPRQNEFSTRWGLDGYFVVMYAGNLGPTQGLENVIEAARLLKEETSIHFVFVGEGTAKSGLEKQARESGLKNIQFIPFQPRELLPLVLASADVMLLTLKRGLGRDSVPSKCYSILSSERPIIASVDCNSDTWALVQKSGSGLCVDGENPQALADAIDNLYKSPTERERFAVGGRTYVLKHCSKAAAAQEFYELLRSLAPSTPHPLIEEVTP